MLAALLFLVGVAVAQTPTADAGLTSNPVFQKNCAKCHGDNAEGRHFHGPSLTSGKAAKMSEDDLKKIITQGKGHMPKFGEKLSADEIDTLAKQIETLNKK